MRNCASYLDPGDPVAVAVTEAIREGDVDGLRVLLAEHSGLAAVRLGVSAGMSRTLLHVAADWPGHYLNGPQSVGVLVAAGTPVNGRFAGPHGETALGRQQ